MPRNRYYGGNEFIDQIENLCCNRARATYRLDPASWGVNVQPYSGSPSAHTHHLRPSPSLWSLSFDLPHTDGGGQEIEHLARRQRGGVERRAAAAGERVERGRKRGKENERYWAMRS
ncbi:serine hydroxymethyltransferase 4 [Cinnamomum micranthum f. kanehirae]|uniref:Serine hydroxymethyltransferase 4 n=1 Tax=Cinnamomum micranthum f. kanehirae TaxID=337451 RepID=A0A3S4P3E9_9MAGN|nr:serine hydroxymethyltransferase 4 [Cinnamomum micranthum f. kanehirae]